MSNLIEKNAPKQLELFPIVDFLSGDALQDKRPAPLIAAERWDFPLTYIDKDGNTDNYLYCARDWYMGLGGAKSNWSTARNDWLYKDNQLVSEAVLIETKRERRAPEMLEYVTEKGIYDITQNMRVVKSNEDRLKPIKNFMSESARAFDSIRRGSKRGKKIAKAISQLREQSIAQRKDFTRSVMNKAVSSNPPIGLLTNALYSKVFRLGTEYTAKKEIVAILGLSSAQAKHLRDNLNRLALKAIELAEEAAQLKIDNSPNPLTDAELMGIVKQCARIVSVSAWELAEFAGVDLVTEKPLLEKGR